MIAVVLYFCFGLLLTIIMEPYTIKLASMLTSNNFLQKFIRGILDAVIVLSWLMAIPSIFIAIYVLGKKNDTTRSK